MTTFSVVAICVGVFVALVIAVVGAVKFGAWGEEIESERWSGQ